MIIKDVEQPTEFCIRCLANSKGIKKVKSEPLYNDCLDCLKELGVK